MAKKIGYWTATVLVAVAYLAGGYFDVAQPKEVQEGAVKLGFPLFFFSMLGVWKILGALALVAPHLPRLKEWAYAGIFINLVGAAVTHVMVKDGPKEIAIPLVILAIAAASWALRPPCRRLAGPWL